MLEVQEDQLIYQLDHNGNQKPKNTVSMKLSTGNKFLDSFDDCIDYNLHKKNVNKILEQLEKKTLNKNEVKLFIQACVYMYRSEAEKLFGRERSNKIIGQILKMPKTLEEWQQWIAIQTSDKAIYSKGQIEKTYTKILKYSYYLKDNDGYILDSKGNKMVNEFNQYFIKKVMLLFYNSLMADGMAKSEELFSFYKKTFPELFEKLNNAEEFEIMWKILNPENVDYE